MRRAPRHATLHMVHQKDCDAKIMKQNGCRLPLYSKKSDHFQGRKWSLNISSSPYNQGK